MGLVTGAIDVVVVSAGCAAVRRFTGGRIHVAAQIQQRIKNPTLKAASIAYFGLGETIVSSSVLLLTKWENDWKQSQTKMREMEDLAKRVREERERREKQEEKEEKDKQN
mmetsp:Transcript_16950/g.23586  ORF Transcript_16950/g.23586 Transcript_16950/m.23586 type:complete len:110 (-) Transcript_16950:256-585(-)